MVEFAVEDRRSTGHLAVPEQGRSAGVLVLHGWWGLTPFFKSVADRFAQAGFVAFAPDLYHGKTATTINEAQQLIGALDVNEAYQEIIAAVEHLHAHEAVCGDGLGVVGFSMGGSGALLLKEHIVAVITVYGSAQPEQIAAQAAFQGHFPEHDEFESVEVVQQVEEHIRALGREVTFYTYSGVQHWFFETDRPAYYDEAAATLVWQRMIEFLRNHLTEVVV
ncbi:MAG: dienelactone hydrolase family protein [Herpetosiphonaceae bacterium]|nr:dienelactone hydrolase family protein [Herpetosiphonaceae bacterium]